MKLSLVNRSPENSLSSQTTKAKCLIKTKELKVSYDSPFILDLPAENFSGNIIAILGHNGAGKSTLIKSILDLLPPKNGKIEVFNCKDNTVEKLNAAAEMAFCPESGSVFSDITVESYIKLWCRLKHGNAKHYKEGGAKYIEALELGPLLKKLGRELSKGQKRRVQTAIGFLAQPKLFLFDEPFDGLDVQRTQELTDLIRLHSFEMNFVISSHRMDVIERLADTLVVLHEGKVLTSGPISKVCHDLAGNCFSLSSRINPFEQAERLRKQFNEAIINIIGNEIILTGREINISSLKSSPNLNVSDFSQITPSLVDAMNYHLKTIKKIHVR